MSDHQVLFSLELEARHQVTGRTRHTAGGSDLPAPHKLALVQYPEAEGVYLLYLDERGQELTDTLHDSVDEAMSQAEFEFGALPGEWVRVSSEG